MLVIVIMFVFLKIKCKVKFIIVIIFFLWMIIGMIFFIIGIYFKGLLFEDNVLIFVRELNKNINILNSCM